MVWKYGDGFIWKVSWNYEARQAILHEDNDIPVTLSIFYLFHPFKV